MMNKKTKDDGTKDIERLLFWEIWASDEVNEHNWRYVQGKIKFCFDFGLIQV